MPNKAKSMKEAPKKADKAAKKPKALSARAINARVTHRPAPKAAIPKPIVIKGALQPLRGMKDILPAEQPAWKHLRSKIEELTEAYGYERIDTPILEDTRLFDRSAGKQSDVVEKEMFTFEDRGGDSVSLRPEGTAGIVRAFNVHGMINLPQPVKLYYVGSMFRYDRPQAGRYREHHQFGVETFGEAGSAQDAEIIMLANLLLKEVGLKTTVKINSIGCSTCRLNYLTELVAYYRSHRNQICEDCKRRLTKSPLRLLDCKEAGCQPVKENAPQIVDFLDEECKNHFMRVLEYLDDLQVPYVLDPHLVRGFDYYNRTVFEIVSAEEENSSQQLSLGGGGRYDGLVEQLGGRPTPACGFGIGMERVVMAMKDQGVQPPMNGAPDVFLAQLGDAARRKAFTLFEEMRRTGIRAAANFSKATLKGQLEVANRLGAGYTLILGQQEIIDGTILLRDMESGMQEVVDFDKAVGEMKKKLKK